MEIKGIFEMAENNSKYIPQVGCCLGSESHPSTEGYPMDSGDEGGEGGGRDGSNEGVACIPWLT